MKKIFVVGLIFSNAYSMFGGFGSGGFTGVNWSASRGRPVSRGSS